MSRRILMIDKNEEYYLYLKSLLEKAEDPTHTLDWLRHWDDAPDPKVFRQYDIIISMNNRGRELKRPELFRELELSALKNRFVTMASHEFRTPLTSIASSAELVEAYVKRGEYEKVGKHVDRIKKSVGDLNGLLTEFLSLDKLEDGKTHVRNREMNLPVLAAEVCDEFIQQLKPGQVIRFEHSGLEIVMLDPHLLKIVLQHLLSNASKYSPPGAPIEVTADVSLFETTICVTDKGIGIPAEDQDRIFDRFYRAGNAANIQGTGLGLYLAKRYVALMGGVMGYSTQVGKGSAFWATFSKKD